jgi:hypothetical protein
MVKNSVAVEGVNVPMKKQQYHGLLSMTEMKTTGIGPYFQQIEFDRNPKRLSRVGKWTDMISRYSGEDFPLEAACNDSGTREKLRKRVVKGPPQQFRWLAWSALRSLSYRVSESAYEDLTLADPDIEAKINKDIDRTYPDEAYFTLGEGQKVLFRILSKYAHKHASVSYCQGMNFIVGFMLLVSGGREVEVFYMLEDLMETFKGFFLPGFPYLRQCLFVFSHMVQKRLPQVHEALERLGVGYEAWATKWFMTLYTVVLPLTVSARIWDLLMTDGVLSLFRAGMTLLRIMQTEVIGHELEDVMGSFDGLSKREFKTEELVKLICRSKFAGKNLRHFERMYRKEVPEEKEQPVSPRQPRISTGSADSKNPAASTSVSSGTFESSMQSVSSVSSPGKPHSSKVPNLPSILRTYYDMEDYEEGEGEDLEEEEPVNARDVLEDMLQDQNCSLISLDSLSNLPRPKSREVDKMMEFVSRLPH